MPTTIYRIVVQDPPHGIDYLTYEQQGKLYNREDPESVRLAQGFSCFVEESVARSWGKRMPWKGDGFVGVYELADDADFQLEQTGRHRGHYTLWCDAHLLQASLIGIEPIRKTTK